MNTHTLIPAWGAGPCVSEDSTEWPAGVLAPTAANLDRAAEVVRSGGVVAVPGDTNVVLAADPSDEHAVERVYEVKRRDRSKPLSLLFEDPADWRLYGRTDHEPLLETLAAAFWPGPFNVILDRTERVEPFLVSGLDTVCVGSFETPVWRRLAARVDPLAATSANRSGAVDSGLVDLRTAVEQVGDRVDLVLGGDSPDWPTQSTTIVDLTGEPTVFREGDIGRERLNQVRDVF